MTMTSSNYILSIRSAAQRGSALVIGLIIVMVLALLGITTFRTITLEERMAGNQRDTNIAFQSSEGALREAATTDFTTKVFDGTAVGYGEQKTSFTDGSGNPVSEFTYWTTVFDWSASALTATQSTGTSEAAKYYVETSPVTGGLWKAGQKAKRAYRITVNGAGASTRARTIVQGTSIQEN